MGQLEVVAGALQGEQIQLTTETLHIGRAQDNDIILDDPLVSRYHAHLTYEEGDFYLIDLNTPNGTFVNKKKILNQKLRPNDVLQVGKTVFRFLRGAETAISAFSGKEIPSQERITPSSPEPKPSLMKKPLFLFLAGFGLLLLIWLSWPTSTPPKKERTEIPPAERQMRWSETQKEAFLINKEKADRFYSSGYREYMAKNYLRAGDDFKAALELYPDHRLAGLYLRKTDAAIAEEIEKNYTSAFNYFKSGQYHLSIHHFRRVMTLLSKRAPPERYCEEKQERQQERQNDRTAAAENPDYTKYCDAKQKIEEALGYLSSHGF